VKLDGSAVDVFAFAQAPSRGLSSPVLLWLLVGERLQLGPCAILPDSQHTATPTPDSLSLDNADILRLRDTPPTACEDEATAMLS
jgi:hypothetical protein